MRAQRSAALLILVARSTVLASLAVSISISDRPSTTDKRVVELVGDPGQQLAQRRQLLVLVQRLALPLQFLLHLHAVGEVVGVRHDHLLAAEVDQPRGDRAPAGAAIAALELGLEFVDEAVLAAAVRR